MLKKPKITVIGSANMDLVTNIDRFPTPGETMFGSDFHQFAGGKGANQAVAASRLGAEVTFVGCVGDDDYGKQIIDKLSTENINIDNIVTLKDTPTGIANILVTKSDNIITVVPGANYEFKKELVESKKDVILNSDLVLLQLEIPLKTVESVIDIAHRGNVPIILNPAPAVALKKDVLKKVDFITPNETELKLLTLDNDEKLEVLFEKLFKLGSNHVIMTYGKKGAVYGNQNKGLEYFKSYDVEVVDTTGAGDTFNGALAVSIARGKAINEAIDFANRAAALSTTKVGAQTGMPTNKEVLDYI